MNWFKVVNNFLHLAVVVGAAYAASNPKWSWIIPALPAITGVMEPPSLPTKDVSQGQ